MKKRINQPSRDFFYIDTDNIESIESLYPSTMFHIGVFTKKRWIIIIANIAQKLLVFSFNKAIKDYRKHGIKDRATKEHINSIYGDKNG